MPKAEQAHAPATPSFAILPHEMPDALARAGDGLKVLSLDCFDTLLWRDCHAPTDLFPALPAVTIGQRMAGEQYARKCQTSLRQRSEVAIEAIYEQALPNADGKARADAVEAELVAEARTCFAFAPTVELMRKAKAEGHKVIIVSDTYLSARQLRTLIERAAGSHVVDLIDRFFVSSEAGLSKSQGLMQKVLTTLKVQPQEVLHIGDNRTADLDASRALGVPALHLVQFSDAAAQRQRYERACHQLIGDTPDNVRALMPQRPILALEEPKATSSAAVLGLSVLGPVFHGFDQWLREEAEALKQSRGGQVHWLFMLRDGHLPQIVHQAGGEAPSTARVEISRFVSIAASLTSSETYMRYFGTELGRRPSSLARQMLFTDEEIANLIGEDESQEQMLEGSYKLADELKRGQRQKITRRRARERADRLVAHVRAQVDPAPGDTLMLVDLGYNGSAQTHVDELLRESFDCHVAGRYLLLRELAATGLDKKGFIDERHYDLELVDALCGNVAVIEQLATCELGSVVDFTEQGEPIREAVGIKGAQSDVRDQVQAGVLRYAKAAQTGCTIRADIPHASRALREGAAGALARFMFLPHASELEVLKSFEHDVNMGTQRTVPLFDQPHAQEGMRRRGLFYMQGSSRMFLPAELEGADIHTRLSLLVQKRFGLGLTYRDNSQPPIAIPAFFMGAKDTGQSMIHAQPTHDGFYSARLPIPKGTQNIALGVGSVFEWFELGGISCARVDTLKGGLGNDSRAEEIGAQLDGLKVHAPGIYECTGTAAFVLVKVPDSHDEDDLQMTGPKMIEIVMRPLIRRKEGSDLKTRGGHATRDGSLASKEKAA